MAGRFVRRRRLLCGLALMLGSALAAVSAVNAESAAPAPPIRMAVVTPESEPVTAPAPVDKRAEATKRVQRCYAQLGYYKGPIDGKANADTWTAHWYFKNDHGLKAYGDFLAEPVQKKIDELCKDEPAAAEAEPEPEPATEPEPEPAAEPATETETAPAPETAAETAPEPEPAAAPEAASTTETPEPAAPEATANAPETPPEPAADAASPPDAAETAGEAATNEVTAALAEKVGPEPAIEEERPPAPTRLAIDCLPQDLIDRLRQAHGAGVRAQACLRGCLPPPAGLNQVQLDDMQSRYGVVWCRDCVQIRGHLSLDDVRVIERAGNLDLCTLPPRRLPRPGIGHGNVVKSYTRIRELYRALPPGEDDPAAIAVIVGNGAYENLPPADTARNDAGAMYFFLTEHLGYRQDHILDMRDAKKADLERVFGPVPGSDGELAHLARSQPGAKVVVYYSGHGATNSDHSESYLLPVDAEPYREEQGGYPLSTLYANLAALKAKSVLVLMESDYGRDLSSYVLPPNLPETTASALPRHPLPNVTVLSATDHGQRALMDTSYDIGLFTRYLIEGLAGSADLYPVGNGDGVVDSVEAYAYTAAMVRLSARETFGLLQEPVYSSGATPVLAGSGEMAAKPN